MNFNLLLLDDEMMISLLMNGHIINLIILLIIIVILFLEFSRHTLLEWTATATTTIEAAIDDDDDDHVTTVPQMNHHTTTKTTTTATTSCESSGSTGNGTVVGLGLAIIILRPQVYQDLDLTLNKLLTEYKTQYHQALEGFSQMLEHALAVEEQMGLLQQLHDDGMDDEDQHLGSGGSRDGDGVDNHRRHRDRMKKKIKKFFSKSSQPPPSSSSSMLLSSSIRRRINRTIECVERDEQVLKQLLSLTTTDIQGGSTRTTDGNDGDRASSTSTNEHTKSSWTSTSSRRNVHMALPYQDDNEYYDRDGSSSLNPMNGDNEHDVTSLPTSTGTTMNGTSRNQYLLYNHNFLRDDDDDDDGNHNKKNEHSYESVIQIFAHIVRDWTKDGRSARLSIYGWICSQILHHSSSRHEDDDDEDNVDDDTPLTRTLTVLVPGSGMGRLAYDISRLRLRRQEPHQTKKQRHQHHRRPICYKYSVEANELSISMTVAASSIISHVLYKNKNNQHQNEHTQEEEEKIGKTIDPSFTSRLSIHPYIMDNLANEIDVERRYDEVYFPDFVVINSSSNDDDDEVEDGRDRNYGNGDDRGSLSFTVGDFGSPYYTHVRRGQYDFVVTAFFLDTAYNVYEYLETIKNLLRKRKGIWINVGPVQWHQKSVFRPSVDELRNVIEHVYHFKILHWAVDDDPVSYRDGGEFPRYTNYDGYRPLRFIASVS